MSDDIFDPPEPEEQRFRYPEGHRCRLLCKIGLELGRFNGILHDNERTRIDVREKSSVNKEGYMPEDVPTNIMMMELGPLLPLLLQSLDLPDQEVKAATIESLVTISQQSPAAVEGHMSMLINRLLLCAADPKENTVVRGPFSSHRPPQLTMFAECSTQCHAVPPGFSR